MGTGETKRTVQLTLELDELEVILQAASELPFKTVAPIMMKIQQQATETLSDPSVPN